MVVTGRREELHSAVFRPSSSHPSTHRMREKWRPVLSSVDAESKTLEGCTKTQVPHLPIKKSLLHQTAFLIVSKKTIKSVFTSYMPSEGKTHKYPSHSLNCDTKELETGKGKCFFRLLCIYSDLDC